MTEVRKGYRGCRGQLTFFACATAVTGCRLSPKELSSAQLLVATPRFRSGYCPSTARFARAQDEGSEVGSGAQDRASLIYCTWRGLPCPASVLALPQGARGDPPAYKPRSGPGPFGSSPSRTPSCDRSGTGASPRYPVRTEFPVEAPEKNKRGSEGGDKDFRALNEFKGLVEQGRKSIHVVRRSAPSTGSGPPGGPSTGLTTSRPLDTRCARVSRRKRIDPALCARFLRRG